MGTAARNQTEGRDYIRKGREGGEKTRASPLLGALLWEPPARCGADSEECGGAGSIARQQALLVPQRLQAGSGTMRRAGQLAVCLATSLSPCTAAAPRSQPPPPGTTAVRRSPLRPPPAMPLAWAWGHSRGCYLSGASSPLVFACTGSSLYIRVP